MVTPNSGLNDGGEMRESQYPIASKPPKAGESQ